MNGRQAESCECVSATEIAKKEMKRNGNENVDVNVNVSVEVKGQNVEACTCFWPRLLIKTLVRNASQAVGKLSKL